MKLDNMNLLNRCCEFYAGNGARIMAACGDWQPVEILFYGRNDSSKRSWLLNMLYSFEKSFLKND